MTNQSVTNQPMNIIQNLPFEIIAIPRDNDYQQSYAIENTVNQHSFKIRIKNKKEPGVKRAVISVPKLNTTYNSKKVRLVNSDQTIVSFDLFIDDNTSKRTQKKSQNKIFQMFKPGCLQAQNEEDNDAYTSTSSNGPNKHHNISEKNTNNCNENRAEKFALRKNFVPNNTTTKPPRSFLGQCKPGGCLDPPYSEEKYPYKPTDDFSSLSLKADIDEKLNQNCKLKNRDEGKAIIPCEIQTIREGTLNKKIVNTLCHEKNDDNLINSLITYPQTTSDILSNIPKEIQNNITKPRRSSEIKPKFVYNEFPTVYYMPPKETKTKNSVAKYNKYENKKPSEDSKIIDLINKNGIATSITPVTNEQQNSEPIQVDNQLEYEIENKTSQQLKKLFDCAPEWTITTNENSSNNKSISDDTISLKTVNKTSSVETMPAVKERKFTIKTLVPNGSSKSNSSKSDDINTNDILPYEKQTNKNELNHLINDVGKNSATEIKPNSKHHVKDLIINLTLHEALSSNKQSVHELFESSSTSIISNNDETKVNSKDINVIYEDEKIFNISPKTSQESLEKIETKFDISIHELTDDLKKDKNTNNTVIIPSLSYPDSQLQIIKPEVTPDHLTEYNLRKNSKLAIYETLFTNQTESLSKSSEKVFDTSIINELNAVNRLPSKDSSITPSIKQISKSQLRQDSKEIDSVINNDVLAKIKQFSSKSFRESLSTPKANEEISLHSFEFQSKDINTLRSTLDNLAKKLDDPSNINLEDVNNVMKPPSETSKIDTKRLYSIETSILEMKHFSRDFMESSNNTSVLQSALNSSRKSSDTKLNIESDNIIKADLEVDRFKDNEEEDQKTAFDSIINERTSTQQSFMVENEIKPVPLHVEMVKYESADNKEENTYNNKMKYKKVTNLHDVTDSNQSFENQQKTNDDVGILNKINVYSNISSKTSSIIPSLTQSIETVERSITNNTSKKYSKSSLQGNGKEVIIKETSDKLPISFRIEEISNDEITQIKDNYNENINQEISFLEKDKSPSQSEEKTNKSNFISTVPEVRIDDNNDTDIKVKSKSIEQLIGGTSHEVTTKASTDLQGTEINFTPIDYEGQPYVSYKQPHKILNSTASSSIAINFGFRTAKGEDNRFLIQTYDPTMPVKDNLEERVMTIKSLIKEVDKKIGIHINSDIDLTLCITRNKIPTIKTTSMAIIEQKEHTRIHKTTSCDKTLNNDTLLQEKINSVYDSLVPLQEIISNLTEEAKLLSQQQILFGQLLSKIETKPLRIFNTNQTCKCNKK